MWPGTKSSVVESRTIKRPAGAGTVTETFHLKSGSRYDIVATARDVHGASLAEGSSSGLMISPGSETTWSLSLESSIRKLKITPTLGTLRASQPQVASVTAFDTSGRTVLLAPGRIEWTVSDPAIMKAEKDPSLRPEQVRLTGLKDGKASLQVKDQESGVASDPLMISVDAATWVDLDAGMYGVTCLLGGMSADGSQLAITKYTSTGYSPYIWNRVNGYTQPSGYPDGHSVVLSSMSDDGRVVTCDVYRTSDTTLHYIWTPSSGSSQYLASETSELHVGGISGDGRFIVGYRYINFRYTAYRWSKETGLQDLGGVPGDKNRDYFATCASTDGSTIVGYSDGRSSNSNRAFIWTEAEGMREIDTRGSASAASSVSGDGSAVAGHYSSSAGIEKAFLWTKSRGFIDLGTLNGQSTYATAISADGTTIVGYSGMRAFRWTADLGMLDLGEPATEAYKAYCVSADGSVIAGQTGTSHHVFRWAKAGR